MREELKSGAGSESGHLTSAGQSETRTGPHLLIAQEMREKGPSPELDEALATCPDMECGECASIVCPSGDAYHFHHDGCPSCADERSAASTGADTERHGPNSAPALSLPPQRLGSAMEGLHSAIMNLPCNVPSGYPFGSALCAGIYREAHRDARHAAAELASAAVAEVEALRQRPGAQAPRTAAPSADKARFLTGAERKQAYDSIRADDSDVESLQRKFCEVNGIQLDGDALAAPSTGGAETAEPRCRRCGMPLDGPCDCSTLVDPTTGAAAAAAAADADAYKIVSLWFAEWELILPPDVRQSFIDDLMLSVRAASSAPAQAVEQEVERQIAAAVSRAGLTLLKKADGYEVRKLGPIVAQGSAVEMAGARHFCRCTTMCFKIPGCPFLDTAKAALQSPAAHE